MEDWFQEIWGWFKDHPTFTGWLVGVSIATLVISAIAVPILVTRMRADYFMPDRDPTRMFANQHPVVRWIGLVLKNVFGLLLFIGGAVMLAAPGQGVLTMFVGLLLMDFPGKRRLELRLVKIKAVHRAIDWIRRKAGRKPLELPDEPEETPPRFPGESPS